MKTKLLLKGDDPFIEDVSRLRLDYLDEEFRDITPELNEKIFESNIKFLKANLGKTLYISVIEIGGKSVSSVYLSINSRAPNLMFPTGVYGEIYGVYTDPNYRNRGFAKQNMLTIMEFARELKGLSCLVLEASDQGAPLYKELGFKNYATGYDGMIYYFDEEKVSE